MEDAVVLRRGHLRATWVAMLVLLGALFAVAVPRVEAVTAGEPANPEAWPWVAALMNPNEPDPFEAQFCAAMQISPGWYLTAAHCLERGGRFSRPEELQIGFGSANLSEITTRVPVRRVVVYPSRKPAGPVGRAYDLALLWTGVAQGVSSPPLSPNWGPLTSTSAWIAGWGDTGHGFPDELMTARVRVLAPHVCRRTVGTPYGTFCAGTLTGKDTCSGDSGGPLMDHDRFYQLIGITSFGPRDCSGLIGVYTHIGHYKAWITQVIRGRTTGRVSLPEIRSTSLSVVRDDWVRASARWCQKGARGHQLVAEFNVVYRDGRKFHTRKLFGRANAGCMTATVFFPPSQITTSGRWRLVAKVHDRTDGLSATEHEAGTLRVL